MEAFALTCFSAIRFPEHYTVAHFINNDEDRSEIWPKKKQNIANPLHEGAQQTFRTLRFIKENL